MNSDEVVEEIDEEKPKAIRKPGRKPMCVRVLETGL